MAYKVLVVDDSQFIQHRLVAMIEEHVGLEVVGIAGNGYEAIALADELQPDIITMDFEMPQLDGISAIKGILQQRNIPVIMFSSLTYEGARVTLDALEAGAVDFINKNFSHVSQSTAVLKKELHTKLLFFAKKYASKPLKNKPSESGTPEAASVINTVSAESSDLAFSPNRQTPEENIASPAFQKFDVVIIGASTGGPVAVSELLAALPEDFSLPVIVVQHMPANFTKALSERLNRLLALPVTEARNNESLTPGTIYIAPGGLQLMLEREPQPFLKIVAGDAHMNYKPSVDIAFASAANKFGAKALGIVLTGMGADGREGARILKQKGGVLWSQDEASCVVYGMPKAVVDAGLSDVVLPPQALGAALAKA